MSGGYTRELVEHLLPAVWDEAAAFGIRAPYTPDDDMPKGSVNVAHGNTLGAHLADIRMAWKRTEMRLPIRQAVFLYYAVEMQTRGIADFQGVTRQAVEGRVAEGVGRITAHLNGERWDSAYDPEESDLD